MTEDYKTNPYTYYSNLCVGAREKIGALKDVAVTRGHALAFVCGPLRAETRQGMVNNFLLHASVIISLTQECPVVAINQLGYNAIFHPEDPKDFELKHELLYAELIKCADYVFAIPGWRESEGSCREVELALKLGLPVREIDEHYMLGIGFQPASEEELIQSGVTLLDLEYHKSLRRTSEDDNLGRLTIIQMSTEITSLN